MLFSRLPRRQWPPVFKYYRDVAQLVEYTSGGRVVARSSRVIPTLYNKTLDFSRVFCLSEPFLNCFWVVLMYCKLL